MLIIQYYPQNDNIFKYFAMSTRYTCINMFPFTVYNVPRFLDHYKTLCLRMHTKSQIAAKLL